MNIQELIEKAKTEQLSAEESKQVFEEITKEFSELKEKDPAKYLELITELNKTISELSASLKAAI